MIPYQYEQFPDQAAFDKRVAELHARGRDDLHIAIACGVHRRTIYRSRRRQGLPTLYGPAGRPTAALHQLQVAA